MRKLRVHFVGGCHVQGYAVRPHEAFAAVSVRLVEEEFPVQASLSPLSKLDRAAMHLAQMPARPDVIVLQLGHYETSQQLFPARGTESAPPELDAGTNLSRRDAWKSELRGLALLPVIAYRRLTRKPIYDQTQFVEKVQRCFAQIREQAPDAEVIVLSCLPLFDHYRLAVRRAANRVLQAETEANGWVYIDNFSRFQIDHYAYFSDRCHLNAAGHQNIGERLAPHLRRALLVAQAKMMMQRVKALPRLTLPGSLHAKNVSSHVSVGRV